MRCGCGRGFDSRRLHRSCKSGPFGGNRKSVRFRFDRRVGYARPSDGAAARARKGELAPANARGPAVRSDVLGGVRTAPCRDGRAAGAPRRGPDRQPGPSAPRPARIRRRDRVTGQPDETDLAALRIELQRTADIPDPTEQMLEITGVVDAALRPIDIRPVVVGGLAVAYWTTGLYLTADIDVVMPHSAKIEQQLAALGFEREGRFWTLPGRDPVFEAPGSTLE